MSKVSELEKELSKWRRSKNSYRGKKTPEHIRKKAIELLIDYNPWEIQKRLGININTLKKWQENDLPEPVFIPLPSEPVRKENISKGRPVENSPSNLSLKISNGSWSLEGVLSLQDWHSALRLLEGVK